MGSTADLPRLADVVRPRATGFVRAIRALVMAKGDFGHGADIARATWPNQLEIEMALRSAVTAGSLGHVGSPNGWGQQLTPGIMSEFVEIVRAASVVSRLGLVHRVPFNVNVGAESTAAVAQWAGEGSPKVASELGYSTVTLGVAKASVITTISTELARTNGANAERRILDSLVKSVAGFIDSQFLDPSVVSSTVHPGSILSIAGASPISPSGTSSAAIVTDLTALVDALLTASGGELVAPMLIMSPRLAVRIALKGAGAYPDLKFSGGMLLGIPVLTTSASNWSTSGGGRICLVDQDAIMLADGGMEVGASTEAALQLANNPVEGASAVTSLWQQNLLGVRSEKYICWNARRAGAAAYLDSVAY